MRTALFYLQVSTVLLALLPTSGFGQDNTWTGQQSSNWNTTANWSLNSIPTPTTNVIVPANTLTYPVISGSDGTAEANNLTIAAGASIRVTTNGNGHIRIHGAIVNNGIFDVTDGTVELSGTAASIIPANAFTGNTVRNLRISNSTTVTLGGPLDLTGILKLFSGTFATGGHLTFKSNAATTALIDEVEGNLTGTVTVERYIPAKRAFRFLSSATSGGTIFSNWQESGANITGLGTDITGEGGAANGFDTSGSNNPSLFTHNNTTSLWQAVTTTTATTLEAGTPYRILIRGDRTVNQSSNAAPPTNTTLRSTGTLITGTVQGYLGTGPGNNGRFIFMGNPYQAPVDMEDVLNDATNFVEQFYYVWDPTLNTRGSYVTVDVEYNINTVPGSAATKYLQPGQAFFARIDNNGYASLVFEEGHKSISANANGTPNVYRNSNDNEPEASLFVAMYTAASLLQNGTPADGFKLFFDDTYSNSIDGMDAVKPTNMDENVGLSHDDALLSFERRAMPTATDVLTLSNTNYRGTDYTYKITVNGLENGSALLHDNYTGLSTPLANDADTLINFTVSEAAASTAENRFSILFSDSLSTGSPAGSSFSVYPNPVTENRFNILLANDTDAKAELYNLLGQSIPCTIAPSGNNTITVEPATKLAAGLYIVKIASGQTTHTHKIVVK